MMKVKYTTGYDGASLVPGTVYDVFDVVEPFGKIVFYGVVDELGDSAYYPWNFFEVVEGEQEVRAYGIPSA